MEGRKSKRCAGGRIVQHLSVVSTVTVALQRLSVQGTVADTTAGKEWESQSEISPTVSRTSFLAVHIRLSFCLG
jgi:hypothetical protein